MWWLIGLVIGVGAANVMIYRDHRRRQRELRELLEVLAASRQASSEMARRLLDWNKEHP